MNRRNQLVFIFVLFVVKYATSDDPSTVPPTTSPDTTSSPDVTTSSFKTTTDVPITTTTFTTTQLPSTTTPAPVTTVAPKPTPEKGTWNVTEGNVTCIRVVLQAEFKITLGDFEEVVALSPEAKTDGSKCEVSNVTEALVLSYNNYNLTFIFEKDSTTTFIRNVTFVYSMPMRTEIFYNDTKLFTVNNGNSYLCRSTDKIIMGNATMEIYQIHLQAFGTAKEDGFNTAEECAADDAVNDIIPIAVSCALAALIIVVLIAYLIGRRRSRQKGYTSV